MLGDELSVSLCDHRVTSGLAGKIGIGAQPWAGVYIKVYQWGANRTAAAPAIQHPENELSVF